MIAGDESQLTSSTPSVLRSALLGNEEIFMIGEEPRVGDRLVADFEISAAWNASQPMKSEDLRKGWVVLSTLPNIQSHACSSQIFDLEQGLRTFEVPPRLFHVSADESHHWREVGEFHPELESPGFTICGADSSREAFCLAFGVGVVGHSRIAHGLFALKNGTFVLVQIPRDQMHTMDVQPFLEELKLILNRGYDIRE
jgi:peroxiredoxin